MNNNEFLAIGDTVADTFIRLSVGEEIVKHEIRELCVPFGEKIPYEFAEMIPGVGNSANAAVAVARLGLPSSLLSNIGDDQLGKECLDSFHDNNVDTTFIKINQGHSTNHHYVLWFHSERTILIKHEEYPYSFPEMSEPKWIYLSSLSKNSLPFHDMISEYLEAHPNVNLVFQPGTFQISLGKEAMSKIYAHTRIFFCNVEEAKKILGSNDEVKVLMTKLADLGPKVVVVTDGPKGAYAYDTESKKSWFMPTYPDPKEPYERTGAGDAFASTFTAALMKGRSIPDAMAWGATNSMSVVQYVGAQKGLLTEEQIAELLKNRPASFVEKEI